MTRSQHAHRLRVLGDPAHLDAARRAPWNSRGHADGVVQARARSRIAAELLLGFRVGPSSVEICPLPHPEGASPSAGGFRRGWRDQGLPPERIASVNSRYFLVVAAAASASASAPSLSPRISAQVFHWLAPRPVQALCISRIGADRPHLDAADTPRAYLRRDLDGLVEVAASIR
jgi:hypothetical protein